TSAWPYINVTPHLGNLVGSVLSADVIARYYRLKGEDVLFVSGSDEHGTPIEVEAIKQGIAPQELTNRNHKKVVDLFGKWNISFDNYTRTENSVHKEFVQQHLMRIYRNGHIFSKETQMLYCEQDQRYLPDRFVEGQCPHCGYERARGDQCELCGRLLETTFLIEPHCTICKNTPTVRTTKHWYIDLKKFSTELSEFIMNNKQLPINAKNFSLKWVEEGLKPRAVTRDVEWGIPAPFPGAEGKTIYVWVEAVLGYVSATIEYCKLKGTPEKWKEFWFNKYAKTLYFVGKDNIPFHTIILPALLLASGQKYNLPWNVSVTEFLQFKGEKASKSQRIGIWIDEALELFPTDYWRFFLIATRPETKDTNFSWDLFLEKINSDLNDTFGNFIHRTLTFINSRFHSRIPNPKKLDTEDEKFLQILKEKVEIMDRELQTFKLQSAANSMIGISRLGNQYLNEKEPWNLFKVNPQEAATSLYVAVQTVKALSIVAAPIIPDSAEKLVRGIGITENVNDLTWADALKPLQPKHKIARISPLFKKIDAGEQELEEMLSSVREQLGNTD
ncbi:methionine--tRNA ligase, partial [Candidatus Bathyarchaeota archaeon]|nr:methionine--tRNA ligase [Candidatus Bathyarchaeota archaeon]